MTDIETKFRIKETFDLRSMRMLMVIGEVVSGVVRVGDRASPPGFEFVVAAVEMLTRPLNLH